MNFVLSIFSVNPFEDSQLCILESSLFNRPDTLERSIGILYSIVVNRLVSSANNINLNVLLTLGRSFIYIRKSSGPKTEPCGTPVVIVPVGDDVSFN